MVRLRDLGGGEPNDDLTWTLFDDPSRPLRPSRDRPAEASAAEGEGDPADAPTDVPAAEQASSEVDRPASSPPEDTA